MQRLFLALLFFALSRPSAMTAKDRWLTVPPVTKLTVSAIAGGYAILEYADNTEQQRYLAAAALWIGLESIPNLMLLAGIAGDDGNRIRFWRNYLFFQELLVGGFFLTLTLASEMNPDEDIYPDGRPIVKESEFLETDPTPYMLGTSAAILATALLNRIPFSCEYWSAEFRAFPINQTTVEGRPTKLDGVGLKLAVRF
jgi:hypothetical protein